MATPDLWQTIATPASAEGVRAVVSKQLRRSAASSDAALSIPLEGRSRTSSLVEPLRFKRLFDLTFAAFLLLAMAPLFAVVAIAIGLDSPGQIFYRADRLGRNGRRFRCFKFRTMVIDAEEQQQRLLHLNERDGVLFKVADDPRVTRVGRVLRKYSLDELPQFFNVLRGEMSVVGPRPPVATEVRLYGINHLRRLSVLPGVTGLWQTQARHDPSFESYVSLDLAYIDNWTVGLDLKIIAQTVGVVLEGNGI
ncbi:MAG TPA: sugar transferase [Terracidiphilus sp.]|nr:sugar transferase [Terracidiphilus sp.]